MAFPLPLPLKVAAGLVVTGVERIRSLPGDVSALPVQAAGYALRLSMKVQQEIAELATKGDETLGSVFGGAQPDRSPLATFDDDLPLSRPTRPSSRAARGATSADGGPGRPAGPVSTAPRTEDPPDGEPDDAPHSGGVRAPRIAARSGRRTVPPTVPVVPPGATIDGVPVPGAETVEPPAAAPIADPASDPAPGATAGSPAGAAPTDDQVDDLTTTSTDTVVPAGWSVTREDPLADRTAEVTEEPIAPVTEADPVVWTTATDEPIAGPPTIAVPLPLPDYDELTVAQVRGHLRRLTADDVQALLEHEQRNGDRAPFLTLLSNRLVTLQHSS